MKILLVTLGLGALILQSCMGQAAAGVAGLPRFPRFSRSFDARGTEDGWVQESSANTSMGRQIDRNGDTLRVGDDTDHAQLRSILSFDTSDLPDNAVITGVRLILHQQAIVGGGDPFRDLRGLVIDIKLGFFGHLGLDSSDFASPADVSSFGPYQPSVADTYSFALGRAAYPYINRWGVSSGLTQFRLRFRSVDESAAQADYISFYSGDASRTELRPQLVIDYHLGGRSAIASLP